MWRLTQLVVRRFRSLFEIGPIPIQDTLTVLTGVNDGGKTALLDALAFLVRGYAIEENDRSIWTPEDSVEVEGTLVDRTAPQNFMRIRRRWTPSGQTSFEVLARVHPRFPVPPDKLSMPELRAKIKELPPEEVDAPGGSSKSPFVEAAQRWLSKRPPHEFSEEWREANKEEEARLPRHSRFSSSKAPSPRSDVHTIVAGEVRRLLRDSSFAPELGSVSERLEKAVAPSLEEIRKKVLDYCPDLENVQITFQADFTSPRLELDLLVRKSEGAPVDLEKSGEGRRRRVTLALHEANLTALKAAEPTLAHGEILTYDEPDTHLDYASQRAMFDILTKQANLPHVQVVVATHSLNFIDKVSLRSILHFCLESNRTRVECLASEDIKAEWDFFGSICAGLGLRNSVLLDERCFMIVEGETEEMAVPALFRLITGKTMTTAGLCLLSTKGSGAVRKFVEILVGKWKRRAVLLLDEDARASLLMWASGLSLTEGNDLFFVGTKELEDAFSDDVWARALNAKFAPKVGSAWTPADINALRGSEKFSEALCNRVRSRCKEPFVSKPDLGLALADTVATATDVPSALRNLFAAGERAAASCR